MRQVSCFGPEEGMPCPFPCLYLALRAAPLFAGTRAALQPRF